ncbi:hypothetical protein GCM10010259_25710 [Streptomyces daghestanicus]|uniref:Uncharacterized protein n=1 Tax=Streptomyces daghestanicus TaxID=66885 RepID=A0ABQ3QAK3_9ACTN|nr:hypothetical protein GCM10010240_01690 [Streptomyces griseoviridis]GGU34044.1 hypothetical protein GCM10010259_25710 [Streptomyces daghestanicus]GHI34279.1 hypothetical protein Sdagh_60090 [Streptomyces daghestanicus]
MRAAMASWAKAPASESSVGAPPTPLPEALTLRPGGIAGPPSMERISEAAAPVTMRTGCVATQESSAVMARKGFTGGGFVGALRAVRGSGPGAALQVAPYPRVGGFGYCVVIK